MAPGELTPVDRIEASGSRSTLASVRTGLIGAALGFAIALVWPRPWKS